MYIKIKKTKEIVLCDSTMSSENGWFYETVDGSIYHESEITTCINKG